MLVAERSLGTAGAKSGAGGEVRPQGEQEGGRSFT